MKTMTALSLTLLAAPVFAQPLASPPPYHPEDMPALASFVVESHGGENQNDPAYKTYKEGYKLILEERWDEARKLLKDVTAKYPGSDYADDAAYWSAYALKHTNRKAALDAYRAFLKSHPKSSYVDDAMADLADLDFPVFISYSGDSATVVFERSPRGYVYGVGVDAEAAAKRAQLSKEMVEKITAEHLRTNDRAIRKLTKGLTRIELNRTFAPRTWFTPRPNVTPEKFDPDTRLKLDALYAIAEKEDEGSFQTLRDVALDRTKPVALRSAALDALSDFGKFDATPVFLEVVKTDTNEQLQNAAIDCIGMQSKDKNKSVETLVTLFANMPPKRKSQLSTILYSIAEIGNDRAIEFLASVARTNDNYDLRRDAVYYLGTIGGEKARAALYGILTDH
jgi:hypothetical protein